MPRDDDDIESGHLLTNTRVLHIDVESINNSSSGTISSAALRFAHSRAGILSFIALILLLLIGGTWINFVATGTGSDSGLPVELDTAMQHQATSESSLSHATVVLDERIAPAPPIDSASHSETLDPPTHPSNSPPVDVPAPSKPAETSAAENNSTPAPHWLGANSDLPPMPHAIPPHSPLASQYVPSPEIRLGMSLPMQPLPVPGVGVATEAIDAYAIAPTERTQIQPLAFVSPTERAEQRAAKAAQKQQSTLPPAKEASSTSAEGLSEFKPPTDSDPILSVPVIAPEADAPAANMETILFVDPKAVSRVDSMQIDSTSQASTVQPIDQADAAAIEQLSQSPEYEKPKAASVPETAPTDDASTPTEFTEPSSSD